MILIPFLSGALYLGGGQRNKWLRWGMGLPIGLIAYFTGHGLFSLWCVATYYVATSALPYGEHSWLNFLGEWGKFVVCGAAFGLASIPAIGIGLGLMQGVIGAFGFLGIKWLDDHGIMKNPLVEIARGVVGTICFVIA